jgi:hypothetical protein
VLPVLATACETAPAGDPDDAWAEALALVWGPRFDRAHLLGLIGQTAALPPPLQAVAERYDTLAPARQQRLRRLILRTGGRHAMGESAAWTASC